MTNEDLVDLCITLPALGALAQKVASVHGPSDPRLYRVRDVFADTAKRLTAVAQGPATGAAEALVQDLQQLRELTDGFSLPPHACRSYRGLLEGLTRVDETVSPLR